MYIGVVDKDFPYNNHFVTAVIDKTDTLNDILAKFVDLLPEHVFEEVSRRCCGEGIFLGRDGVFGVAWM